MISSMNQEKFLVELKQLHITADFHRRYYAEQSTTYHRLDYWLKSIVGLVALAGSIMAGFPDLRMYGAFLAGACAILVSYILPRFKWDDIISGFKDDEQEWMRIFKGYEDIISFTEISDRGEILVQEFQRVKEMQKAAALTSRKLPQNKKLNEKIDAEVRAYWNLPNDPYKTE